MKFKVKHQEYVNRTFRFKKEFIDRLDKVCDEENISLNKLIVQCVEFALENMESSNVKETITK